MSPNEYIIVAFGDYGTVFTKRPRGQAYNHPIQHFPSVDHWRKGTLSASTLLGCDISRYHRIHVRQWRIGGCDMHDTEVS